MNFHSAQCNLLPQMCHYIDSSLCQKESSVKCAVRESFPKALRIKMSLLNVTLKMLTDGWVFHLPSLPPTFSSEESCLHESKAHCEMFFDLPFVFLPGESQKQWNQNAKGLPTNCVSLSQPSAAIYKSQSSLTIHQGLEGLYHASRKLPSKA